MTKKLFIIVLGAVLTCSSLADAQKKVIRRESGDKHVGLPDDMFELPELAAIVAVQAGNVVIDHVMDKNMRPKENAPVDIQEGDIIMMANGKRVKSIADLTEAYTSAAVGSAVKLGIERDEQMSMVSFDKLDPEKLPKRRIMINKGGGDGGRDMMMVPGTGLLVGSKGKEVSVEDILTDGPSSIKDADVKKGDLITAVNDAKVASFKDFSNAYEKIAVGDKVTLHTSRKGEHLSFTFTKAEPGQQRVIKRTQD